ncbi:Fic family protein [Actinokineospora baliensis]|uniref:Fic family protein n=1 Tax=Actinokineospora baliensis TaxID=547056 RepID=UPI00195E6625|nr:Fic/DOC family N-terminal domain-containing protein [Actinokineospora baliensis]
MRSSPAGMWIPVRDGRDTVPVRLAAEGAFLPKPLPSDVLLSSRTHRGLADAQEALGRLDEATVRLLDPSALVRATQVREVQRSARLDGISTALLEVLVSQLPGVRPDTAVEPAITSYLRAGDTGFAAVRAGVTDHVALMSAVAGAFGGSESGIWRTHHTWLGGSDPFLLASPPGAASRAAFEQFAAWSGGETEVPVLAKVALGHFFHEVVRPFRHGNGHIARLYVGLELARSGVLRGQVLPLSTWIDRNLGEYRARVRLLADEGDYEQWISFFANGIRAVSREELSLITKLEAAHEALHHRLSGRRTGNIRKVLTSLIATPVTNHRQIAELHGITTKNAGDVCARLVDAGVLHRLDDKPYAKAYYAPDLLRLLSLTDPLPHRP